MMEDAQPMDYSDDDDSEDPVVKEVDVHLSQSLANRLYMLQYPLHPGHSPYDADKVLNAEICNEGEGIRLDIKVRPRGDNYSTSRGSNYARMINAGSSEERGKQGEGGYVSDLWDKITLSTTTPSKGSASYRYAAAVFKDGNLHLTPLQGILQLRPDLQYLDKVEGATNACNSGGDTTESEGEEARPVTVRFTKPEGVGKSQKSVGQRMSYTNVKEKAKSSVWTKAEYFGVDSEEAEEERRLLLASCEDQAEKFNISEEAYFDVVFPREIGKEVEEMKNRKPSGVVSLEQIKTLSIKNQVLEVLRGAHMIHFKQLCSMLGVSGSQMGDVLDALMSCAVLVQGCWVVASSILYPEQEQSAMRNARDYILHCFNHRRTVPRKDIMGVVKLPNEEVRQLMQTLGNMKFKPQQAWEFKLDSDVDFINRNLTVVLKEEDRWCRRYKELLLGINLRSPASLKSQASLTSGPAATENPSGSVAAASTSSVDHHTGTSRHTKDKPSLSSLSVSRTGHPEAPLGPSSAHLDPSSDDVSPSSESARDTPQRTEPSASLKPCAIIKKEVKEELMEEEEEAGVEEDMTFVTDICCEVMKRGLVELGEMRDKLLLRLLEAGEMGHPPRGRAVSDTALENGLQLSGAMEVGQPYGKRLFALPLKDECRIAILELFQSHKAVRKKQVMELLQSRGISVSERTVLKTLKELCYSKGGHWRPLGT